MFRLISFLFLFCFLSFSQASDQRDMNRVVSDTTYIFYFPTQLSFWNSTQGKEFESKLHLRQGDENSFFVKSVETSSQFITAELLNADRGISRAYSIRVVLSGDMPPGPFTEELKIITDHPYESAITVPILGNVLDGLVLDPQNFGMRLNYFKRQASGMIKITSLKGEAFEIKQVGSSFPGMKAAVIPSEECCSHIIGVVVSDKEKLITKPTTAVLHIETTSKQGMVIVPVLIEAPEK